MSRPRQRPTREETRLRLMQAAAGVFANKGIGAASIEDICTAAGFSRGAFYSNFGAKDELVVELLGAHLESSIARTEEIFAESANPLDFLENMETSAPPTSSPLGDAEGDLLEMELMLYALRSPASRPRLVEQLRRQREVNKKIIEQISGAIGKEYPVALEDVTTLISAFDRGLSLQRMIDPDSVRPGQFSETVVMLHQLWLDS